MLNPKPRTQIFTFYSCQAFITNKTYSQTWIENHSRDATDYWSLKIWPESPLSWGQQKNHWTMTHWFPVPSSHWSHLSPWAQGENFRRLFSWSVRSPWVQPEAGVGDHAIQRNTRWSILINQCQPVTWFFTGCLPQNQLQNDHQLWVKLLDMMLPHNHNKLPPGSCSRLKIIDQVWSSYEVTK